MKFMIGDRVRVYQTYNDIPEIVPGTIIAVHWGESTILEVDADWLINDDGRKDEGGIIYACPEQCRKLKPKLTPKFSAGQKVAPTDELVKFWRETLFDQYRVGDKLLESDLSQMLMLAMSDIEPPSGEIVKGQNKYGGVRVKWTSRFGAEESYYEAKHLKRVK